MNFESGTGIQRKHVNTQLQALTKGSAYENKNKNCQYEWY